jgi:uncharacterized OsmC-like protein
MNTPTPLTYDIEAEQILPHVSTSRAKRAQIYFDSSPGQSEHLMNPAELLLSAFAACIIKNVERFSDLIHFSYADVKVRVHGVREGPPPQIIQVRYEIELWTDATAHKVDLLHRNLRKFGTIFNTVSAACDVSGRIITHPASEAEKV